MTRIVSLLPSSTEIVAALGFVDRLVGRSHECDFPPEVEKLPVCTAPEFNPEGTSGQIDARVRALVQAAVSVYRVDVDVLNELQPDLILTQAQCDACAVSLRAVEEAAGQIITSKPEIVSLEPATLAGVWDAIRRVAEALDAPGRGLALFSLLKGRIDSIRLRLESAEKRPAVACIEWIEPLMAAGNWMPELVEMVGGENLFGEAGQPSPRIEWADLKAADPEFIVFLPCGYDIEKTRAELPALSQRPAWRALAAVQNGRVYLTDGNHYFNRPGPRLVESLEILAEIIHPDAFNFGHRGAGWVAL